MILKGVDSHDLFATIGNNKGKVDKKINLLYIF